MQNHDQVGNRAFGERIAALAADEAVHAATALLLLAPEPPLLFMGQEWGCARPFPFFCDFGPDLAERVVAGRREEFADFPEFRDPAARERIPDPMADATFAAAVLDWDAPARPAHSRWLNIHRQLLALRHRELVPRLRGPVHDRGGQLHGATALTAAWTLGDGSRLAVTANLGEAPVDGVSLPGGRVLYTTHPADTAAAAIRLPPWSVVSVSG
ncbi:MAG: DUF3459 domain-containing protein [Gammaproteobacteria bacterium]|nr:DUF3459 domain-containing protein [Gammaproteobacteria bacterium]